MMNFLEQMKTLYDLGQPFVTATVVWAEKPTSAKPGAKAIITKDGELFGWVGGSCAEPQVKRAAAQVLRDGSPRLLRLCPPERMGGAPREGVTEVQITCASGGTLEIFIEPHLAQPHLIVVGHQAVAQALASLAKTLEYTVTVIGENITREGFPTADTLIATLDFSGVNINENTYIVVTSHGNYDELALEALLPGPAAYIALVASQKRAGTVRTYLSQSGMDEALLARLKYPAGLDFGAVTPAEIALSILAEIIQACRRGLPQMKPAVEAVEPGSPPLTEPLALPMDRGMAAEPPIPEEPETAIDPVCGMSVEISTSRYQTNYAGQMYYFCAAQCQHRFEKHPPDYLKPAKELDLSA